MKPRNLTTIGATRTTAADGQAYSTRSRSSLNLGDDVQCEDMTPIKTTTIVTPDPDAIITEIEIAAPAERVFRALTDSDQLMRWFTDTSCPVKFWRMDARPGGNYSYASEKSSIVVNGVSEFKCRGEILEFDPPHLLVYTWIANWHLYQEKETIVRWELTPTASGTHVKVTHSGLAQEPAARADYSGGWSGVVKNLKEFVEHTTLDNRKD
jgi:uncharacterized protein YndB with AHSA1/START domain